MLSETLGVSVTSECPECVSGTNLVSILETQEVKCASCYLDDEFKSDELAWNRRANERLAEGDVITDLSEIPVASDWVGSETRTKDDRVRNEFKPSTYDLRDRCPSTYFLGEHIYDLDEDEQRSVIHLFEMVCLTCNLVYPKRTGCQECK